MTTDGKVKSMSKQTEAKTAKRREFLKLAGLGTVAGAAAAAGSMPRQAEAASASPKDAGYRETEHVKKAYALSRF